MIETNLVFVEVFTADEAALVVSLLRIPFGSVASYLSLLDAVATDVFERGTRAVNQNHRLHDLLGRELDVAVF